jgi:hypothetical protein
LSAPVHRPASSFSDQFDVLVDVFLVVVAVVQVTDVERGVGEDEVDPALRPVVEDFVESPWMIWLRSGIPPAL